MAQMNTLMSNIAESISNSSDISAWAAIEYDRKIIVFENCDPRNDPGESDCPMVILYPVQKSSGLAPGVKSHIIGISCVVFDNAKPESIGEVISFSGGTNVETLREFVLAEILDTIPSDLHVAEVVVEYDTIDQFPYVSAHMQLTLTQEKLIGSDPYE